MATGTTTQWAVGTGFDYQYADGFVDAVFRNGFLGLTHPVTGAPVFPRLPVGDSSYRWKAQTAGNSSVAVFTEGAAAATPAVASYANLALAYQYFWGWIRISGHIRDVMKNSTYTGLNPIANEFISTTEDIRDLMATSFMGSSYGGLEAAIDSGTTYAGQARGSAGWFEASETAITGALTKASLSNSMELAEDNDKGGKISLILAPRNQLTNYQTLSGTPNTQNHSFRATVGDLRGGFDVEAATTSLTFQGVPIVGIPDMTNTVMLGLDLRPTPVGPNLGLSVRREFEMGPEEKAGDDRVFQISSAAAMVCHMPKFCWKNTGVTA